MYADLLGCSFDRISKTEKMLASLCLSLIDLEFAFTPAVR